MKTLKDYINIVESQLSEAPVDPRSQAERDSQMAAVKAAYKDSQDAEKTPAQPAAKPAAQQPAAQQPAAQPTAQASQPATADPAGSDTTGLGSADEWRAHGYTGGLVKNNEPAPAAQAAQPAAPKQSFSKAVQDIAKASGIADPNKIKVGQKIKLPNGGEYTVAAGDTLGAIAAGKYKGTAPAAAQQSAQPAAQSAPTPKTADELRGFDPAETKKIQDMSAAITAEKDPTKKAQLQKQLTDFTASIGPKIAARAQANQQQDALASTAIAGANAALARSADNAMAKPAAQTAANLATGAVQSAQAATTPTTGVNTGVAKPTVVAQPGQTTTQTTTQQPGVNPVTTDKIARLKQLAGQVPKTTTTSSSTAADGTKTTTTQSSGQSTMIAGKPVTAGQPLDQNQMAAIELGTLSGNKYDPAIMAQFQKQKGAQGTSQSAQPAQQADF